MLFQQAGVRHLGIARALVFGILLVDLLVDDLPTLAAMPQEAFLAHGVLRLLPSGALHVLLQEDGLRLFSWIYGCVLACGVAGLGPAWVVTGAAIVGTTWFHGVARGFGGHVNHQELIVLHSLVFLIFNQSFKAFSLNAYIAPAESRPDDRPIAVFLLRALCFWILLTYFFVGVARLQASDWRVYQTNAMTYYALQHSVKWNWWELGWARNVLENRLLDDFLRMTFPLATLLELTAPAALFVRRLLWPIVLSLAIFHVSILLFMNLFFWQNLLLLLLPCLGWWVDRPCRSGQTAAARLSIRGRIPRRCAA
jgi:hypothetical protein